MQHQRLSPQARIAWVGWEYTPIDLRVMTNRRTPVHSRVGGTQISRLGYGFWIGVSNHPTLALIHRLVSTWKSMKKGDKP